MKDVTIIVLSFLFFSCSSNEQGKHQVKQWEKIVTEENRDSNYIKMVFGNELKSSKLIEFDEFVSDDFIVKYPKKWKKGTKHEVGTRFIFNENIPSPKLWPASINLQIQDLTNNEGLEISLDDYLSISKMQIAESGSQFSFQESKKFHDNKHEYGIVIVNGNAKGFNLKTIQKVVVKNNKAFLLTFMCDELRISEYKEILTTFFDQLIIK